VAEGKDRILEQLQSTPRRTVLGPALEQLLEAMRENRKRVIIRLPDVPWLDACRIRALEFLPGWGILCRFARDALAAEQEDALRFVRRLGGGSSVL